jgi:hypothetical protein
MHEKGNQKVIERFFDRIKGTVDGNELPLDFNRLIKEPARTVWDERGNMNAEEYDAYLSKHKKVDGYNWRCNNWGVKWNCDSERHGNTIILDTPWVPPIPIINKMWEVMQRISRKLHMCYTYEEPGMLICGEFTDGTWVDYPQDCEKCMRCNWAQEEFGKEEAM